MLLIWGQEQFSGDKFRPGAHHQLLPHLFSPEFLKIAMQNKLSSVPQRRQGGPCRPDTQLHISGCTAIFFSGILAKSLHMSLTLKLNAKFRELKKEGQFHYKKLFKSFKMSTHMIGPNHGHKIPLLWLKAYPG